MDPTKPNKLYIKNDQGKNYESAWSLYDIRIFVDAAVQHYKPVDLQLINIGKKSPTVVPAGQFTIPDTPRLASLPVLLLNRATKVNIAC